MSLKLCTKQDHDFGASNFIPIPFSFFIILLNFFPENKRLGYTIELILDKAPTWEFVNGHNRRTTFGRPTPQPRQVLKNIVFHIVWTSVILQSTVDQYSTTSTFMQHIELASFCKALQISTLPPQLLQLIYQDKWKTVIIAHDKLILKWLSCLILNNYISLLHHSMLICFN